jgi:hypothetical protein
MSEWKQEANNCTLGNPRPMRRKYSKPGRRSLGGAIGLVNGSDLGSVSDGVPSGDGTLWNVVETS